MLYRYTLLRRESSKNSAFRKINFRNFVIARIICIFCYRSSIEEEETPQASQKEVRFIPDTLYVPSL